MNFVDSVNSGKLKDENGNTLTFYSVDDGNVTKDTFFECLSISLYGRSSCRKELRVQLLLTFAKMVWNTEFHNVQEVITLAPRMRIHASCCNFTAIQLWVHRMSMYSPTIHHEASTFLKRQPELFAERALEFIQYNRREGRVSCKFTFCALCSDTFNIKTQLYHVYLGQVIHTEWIYPYGRALPKIDLTLEEVSIDLFEEANMTSLMMYHANNRFYLLIPRPKPRRSSLKRRPTTMKRYTLRAYSDDTKQNMHIGTFTEPALNGHRVHLYSMDAKSELLGDGRTYSVYPAQEGARLFDTFRDGEMMYVYALKRVNGRVIGVLQAHLDTNQSYPYFLTESSWRGVAVVMAKSREAADQCIASELKLLVKQ